jgi:hypothetical protein
MGTLIQPTEENLRRAWRILRRPCWPLDYEDTMVDPIRAQLVRMYARHLALAVTLPDCYRPNRASERRTQQPALLRPPPTVVDRKRAAAGDRDD